MKEERVPFKEGQRVVYPLQGVGIIEKISNRKLNEEEILYYSIYIEANDMMVMIPVEKTAELGIRALVTATAAKKALTIVASKHSPMTADWKQRYQINYDLLKKGEIEDIALVVCKLYQRSRVKELPIMERKIFDSARRLLIDEVSFVLQRDKDEVEQEIQAKLEKMNE